MPSPSLPYGLPAPRTWSLTRQPVKSTYLRADAAQAVALLSQPPVFTGTQAAAQSIPNSADTPVTLDTEIYDNAYGHLDTTLPADYFGTLAGWYLCQGTGAVAYAGGAGATAAGIALSVAGGAITTWYGQRIPSSGLTGARAMAAVAKLIPIVNPGRPSGDYVNLILNQNSGAAQNTSIGTNRAPWLTAEWVAASTGTAALPVPANDPWPPPATTLTAQAASGTATLHVASAAGLAVGGTVGLDTGAIGVAETAVIAAGYTVGSLTVPLTANLAHTHASGAPVAVPLSGAFLNRNVRDTINFLIYPPIMEAYYAAGVATLATQAALPATGHLIPCDTTRVDNYGAFSTITSIWTAPVAGTYWAYCQAHQSMNATSQAIAAGLTITSANYNGGTQFTWWGGAQAALAGPSAGNCAITRRRLRLAAGDTVSAAAFQNDSGTATTTMDFVGGTSISESRLIIVWRGA